jgi:hypothetical protein
VAGLRRLAAEEMGRLRERRLTAPDPGPSRLRAMEAAAADTSKEAQLHHRYEMAHEQSLRAAIRGLLALEKSGADLPEEPEAIPEAVAEAAAAPDAPGKPDPTTESPKVCAELASVGAAAPAKVRPGRSSGSPKRPGRSTGAVPGPKSGRKRS